MINLLKTSIVITVLAAMVIGLLGLLHKRNLRSTSQTAVYVTGVAFLVICIGQIYVAFAALIATTAFFARKRAVGVGVGLFLIITLPQIAIKVMAGSLQLSNVTTIACVGLGLLVASLFWRAEPGSHSVVRDLPACLIILVLVFIAARDSTLTNLMRVVTDVILGLVIPYLLVRRGLHDASSIRNAFLMVVAAGLSLSAVAIFESVRVWPMYQIYAQQFGLLGNAGVKMRGGMLRAGGPMMNPPLSGAILALCFTVAFSARDLFRTATAHRIVLVILVLGLFAMQARSAWLGAACGVFGVMFSRRGVGALARYIPIGLLAGGGVYALAMVNPQVAGLVGFSADAKGSNAYRDQLVDQGLAIVKAHPLIGQSTATVELQMANMRQGEGIIDFVNGYLSIALFAGLIGLGLFAGALLLQAYNSQVVKKIARRQGAGGLADAGLGVVAAAASMYPVIPTDSRIICTMLLLFALCNSVERNFRIPRAAPRRQDVPAASWRPVHS